jgi:hypothetical protein
MIDKVQKIRDEVVMMHNLLPVMDGDNISLNYADRICTTLEMYIDSLQEEPVSEDLGDYINELSKQFPEVSFAKLSRIAVMVSRWQRNQDVKNKLPKVISRTDLDEYAYQCAYDMSNDWAIDNPTWHDVEDACKLGAKWQEEHLWKPADGEDLPEIDREVIVLVQEFPDDKDHLRVAFAHRPSRYTKVWNSDLGEKQIVEIERYDKGGWNIPNVKYWLDVKFPKEIEL